MHVWIVEKKDTKYSQWEVIGMFYSRITARGSSEYNRKYYYKTRVVKYISTKGE